VLRSEAGSPVLFQRDPTNGQYWFNGRSYADEASFLAATVGATSSAARVFGPYMDPAGTSYLSNGTFDTNTTGWTAGASGSIASVGGECQFTSGGNFSYFAQALSVSDRKRAFKIAVTGRRGTSTNNFQIVGGNSSLAGGIFGSTQITSTTPTEISLYMDAIPSGGNFAGIRVNAAPGSGTALFDNFTAIECWPFRSYPNTETNVLVEATTPASTPGSAQVIWQSDVNTERDRQRLYYDTDGHLKWANRTFNVDTDSFDLGAVATSTAFSVAWTYSSSGNVIRISLDGGVAQTKNGVAGPGPAFMRIGRSFTGEAWAGSDPFVAVW
jgi:hypothetical protein